MPISVVDANLDRSEHCTGLVAILDEYARLPHIAGRGLPAEVIENLTVRLASFGLSQGANRGVPIARLFAENSVRLSDWCHCSLLRQVERSRWSCHRRRKTKVAVK